MGGARAYARGARRSSKLVAMSVAALDSILQKAEELELTLRGWRKKLGIASSPTRLNGSVVEDESGSGGVAPKSGKRCSVLEYDSPVYQQSMEKMMEDGVREQEEMMEDGVREQEEMMEDGVREQDERGGKVDSAWHHLTSYIVQLEKRVRELETGQATHTAGDGASHSATQEQPATPLHSTEEIAERAVEADSQSQALLLVFQWLTTAELCTASQVCHRWRTVSHHPHLWRNLSLRETVLTSQDLSNLGNRCRLTHTVTLHGLMPVMAEPDEELHCYIARQRGSLECGLAKLLSAAPQLTTLSVTDCNLMITERLLWLCSVHCPQLQHFTYSSDEFPPTPAALWALSNGCTLLQSLHLPPYLSSPFSGYFNDFCLSAIAKGWPHLLRLTVGGAGITAAGLSEIVRYCPWLEVVCVEYGPQLSSSDITDMTAGGGLTYLQSLTLSFTPISPKALHQLSAACPKLASLTLNISPNTYFPDTSAESAVLNTKYHQIHSNFQEMQHMPKLKNVFHLHHHSLSTNTVI